MHTNVSDTHRRLAFGRTETTRSYMRSFAWAWKDPDAATENQCRNARLSRRSPNPIVLGHHSNIDCSICTCTLDPEWTFSCMVRLGTRSSQQDHGPTEMSHASACVSECAHVCTLGIKRPTRRGSITIGSAWVCPCRPKCSSQRQSPLSDRHAHPKPTSQSSLAQRSLIICWLARDKNGNRSGHATLKLTLCMYVPWDWFQRVDEINNTTCLHQPFRLQTDPLKNVSTQRTPRVVTTMKVDLGREPCLMLQQSTKLEPDQAALKKGAEMGKSVSSRFVVKMVLNVSRAFME